MNVDNFVLPISTEYWLAIWTFRLVYEGSFSKRVYSP